MTRSNVVLLGGVRDLLVFEFAVDSLFCALGGGARFGLCGRGRRRACRGGELRGERRYYGVVDLGLGVR